MKKLIIIYGWNIERIQPRTGLDRLMRLLAEAKFTLTQEILELGIQVYRSPNYADQSKITHVITNFGDEVSEIRFYVTQLK